MPRNRRTIEKPSAMAGTDGSNSHWIEDSLSHVRELSNHVAELSTLMGISTLLSADAPLLQGLEAVCRLSAEICQAQVCFIHLADGEDDLVCVARHTPTDAHEYTWEGIARIYGRKATQKGEMVSCANLLLRQEGQGDTPHMGGICAVPLKGKSRPVGAIGVGFTGTHRFSAREKDILNAVAAQVAVAVERSWLFDQLQEQLARARSLRQVATQIASNLDLDLVLDAIVSHASRLLAAEYSAIFLNDHAEKATDSEGLGGEREQMHPSSVHLEDSPLGRAVRQARETAQPAIVQSLEPYPSHKPPTEMKPNEYRVVLAVPLLSHDEVLGALALCYLERRRFDSSDIALVEDFAGQAALAIRNARLYQEAMEDRLSLESAIDQINTHGISLMDDNLNLKFANPAAFWLLGVNPRRSEMSLDQWKALCKKGLAEEADLDQVVEQIRANPEQTVTAKLSVRGSSDTPKTLQLLSLPFRQADGTIRGRVNLIESTEC
ncbi:MAG TPA: GAF domain-containing protein [Chloroflexota bacterium]|nr:GAF domain-containing protein [Chloroflexota bacterium]